MSILESSATRRDAKAYIKRYLDQRDNPAAVSTTPATSASSSPSAPAHQTHRIAIVSLRRVHATDAAVLSGVARTLCQLHALGLLCVVVFWVIQLPFIVVASLVSSTLSLSPSVEALVYSLGLAIATLLSMTEVVPFAAGAISLLSVDQRMRLEGFDLVLQRAARASGNGS